MAKFYQTDKGDTGLRRGGEFSRVEGPIPDGAEVVEFDEAANPELMDVLCGRTPGVLWQDIAIIGGQIVVKGEPIAINPAPEPKPDHVAEIIEWAETFRAKLQTATTIDELKIEDAKHPRLPEKELAAADSISESNV